MSDVLDRFAAEAQAAAGINHPNLCTVHDVGESEGVPYLTMSYVRVSSSHSGRSMGGFGSCCTSRAARKRS